MKTPLHNSAASFGLGAAVVNKIIGLDARFSNPKKFAAHLENGHIADVKQRLEDVLSEDLSDRFDRFVQQLLHLYGTARCVRKNGVELTLFTRGPRFIIRSSSGAKLETTHASSEEAIAAMNSFLQKHQDKRSATEALENEPKRRRLSPASTSVSNSADLDDDEDDDEKCDDDEEEEDESMMTEEQKNLKKLLNDELIEVQGTAARPYEVRCRGGVFYCTCMAWRNQRLSVDVRTCKHLRKVLGEEHEAKRCGNKDQIAKRAKKAKADKAKLIKSGGAPSVMLAQKFNDKTDPMGWLMSEKLDGVRAYWNGSQFVSRQGNVFYAPAWFTKGLPKVHLDGELWTARDDFQTCVSIVRSHDSSDRWKTVLYRVFDAPQDDGGFEQRLESAKKHVKKCEKAVVVEHVVCRGHSHLDQELDRILKLGGEGLMLRRAGSAYRNGRTTDLLKVKKFDDDDALVIAHVPGKGKHTGLMGALRCRSRTGKVFKVGSGFSDTQRAAPPAVDTVISYKYQGLTKAGIPRFPIFLRQRTDIDKDDFDKSCKKK